MSIPQQLVDTINITRKTNADKNDLYVLGYLMQEMGEFCETIYASVVPNSRYKLEHNEHVFEEAADVIQNVYSHLAMVKTHGADNIIITVQHHMKTVETEWHDPKLTIAVPSMSGLETTNMLMAAVGRFAQSSMIEGGHITHKSQSAETMWLDAAIVINNVFVAVKKCYPEFQNTTLQQFIMKWIDKKNTKWLNVTSTTAN